VVRPIVVPNIPGSTTLIFPRDPAAGRLLAFIQDPNRSVGQGTRFDFDRLLFATNSAVPRPGSESQITDIAAILKAYPNTRVRIEGHTDSSGGAGQNMQLGQDRANGVKSALVAKGISPARLEAQGYGSQSPAADNSTAAGRAMNRRVSVIVLQK
jgi:outer membrane protein OmpA-like peptidoglycan-associated protein